MKNKPALIFAIIVAVLSLAAQPLLAIVNPPFGTGGSGNDNKKCQGESKGGEEESYHSFDWSLDLGKVRFSTPKSYMTYARLGVAEGSRRGALPRSLDQVVKFYQGGGYMNRKMLKLDLSSPEINASLRNPESFTYDQSTSAEIIELDGFVNQIRTDDAITHVDKFPGGFTIRMWNLEDFHLQAKENNLYPVPDIASDTTFLAKITFRKPTPESGDNELLITSVQRFGETFKKTTRHLVESELAQYDLREPGADGPQSSQSDPFKTLTVSMTTRSTRTSPPALPAAAREPAAWFARSQAMEPAEPRRPSTSSGILLTTPIPTDGSSPLFARTGHGNTINTWTPSMPLQSRRQNTARGRMFPWWIEPMPVSRPPSSRQTKSHALSGSLGWTFPKL